ncbi:MAG: NAD(P)H-dependent oxidoreductase [Candidatus Midichloria sp.]|nr:MAG: NAD(P)H-dependent oxidoreductase [Candidatus Midichloria sp.]
MKNIVAIPGSLRKSSLNLELIKSVCAQFNTEVSAWVTPQAKLELPIFNQDIPLPESLSKDLIEYKNLLKSSDGILIASPEYNGSVSGGLKNFIDWLSREQNPFLNKKVGLISISTSPFGGVRGLMHLRDIMMQLCASVYPRNMCISTNGAAYSEQQLQLIKDFASNFFNFVVNKL